MTSRGSTTKTPLFYTSPERWKPHGGQKKMMKFQIEHAAAAIFADPGTGKTSATYGAFEFLRKRGLARTMLVIAPLNPARLVWPAEASKWEEFRHLRVELLHGPGKEDALGRDADVYVINPEGLEWLLEAKKKKTMTGKSRAVVDVDAFRAMGFDVLVVDELTMFKHTTSFRFKLLKAVHGTFRYRWGLTGTPAPNGLIDLFGQCYILDEGRTLGRFVTHFRSEYFVPGFDGTSWILQRGAEPRIYDRLRPLALRLQAADYVDMPEVVEIPVRFDLPAAARKVYDALEDDLLANIDSGLVTAKNAAVASNKLRQVASGGVYLDEELEPFVPAGKKRGRRDVGELHDGKVSLLADLVDELQGSPLLVAYDFRHDLSRIRERFGDVPYIGGGVSTKRVSEIERAWNDGEIPLLAVHPQSASHGLNLQKSGNHVCWFTPTWDYERYEQLNRRVARQGAAFKRVFVHVLIARGTVDDRVFWKLRGKARTQSDLLDALLDGRRRPKKDRKL